jgi:hypothetical protein
MSHPHVETILRYYRGCNTADEALMRSTFADEVVHYYVDHAPVRGADQLAHYWARVGPRTQAHWTLDRAIVEGDEAVIEWSMTWVPVGTERQEILRGTEWYTFRAAKILEIRSYHNNPHLADPANFELREFPYEERGYTSAPGSSEA